MLKLNVPLYHRVLGSAVAGNIDNSDLTENLSRTVDTAIGHDPDALPDSQFQHPILVNGKTSAKGVELALSMAVKNQETELIPALEKIQEAIKSHGETPVNLSMVEALGKLADRIELARTIPLAKCPECGSYDVSRASVRGESGPQDTCKNCDNSWAHVPGSITAMQYGQRYGVDPIDDEHESDQNAPAEIKPDDVAYDPDQDLTEEFVNNPANPDGTPRSILHSYTAQKLFGVPVG